MKENLIELSNIKCITSETEDALHITLSLKVLGVHKALKFKSVDSIEPDKNYMQEPVNKVINLKTNQEFRQQMSLVILKAEGVDISDLLETKILSIKRVNDKIHVTGVTASIQELTRLMVRYMQFSKLKLKAVDNNGRNKNFRIELSP